MFRTFNLILDNLSKPLKKRFYLLIFLGLLTAILETVGVASISPIIKIILSPEEFLKLEFIQFIQSKYKLILQPITFAYFFIFASIIFFILKAIFIIFTESLKLKFINKINVLYSSKIYNNYIYTDIKKFNEFKFSEKIKNIGQTSYITGFLKSFFVLFIESILFSSLLIFLLFFNVKFTILLFSIFSIFLILVLFLTQMKILNLSKIKIENTTKTFENLLNVLNSLKEIIILKRRFIFQKKFSQAVTTNVDANYKQDILKFLPKVLMEVLVLIIILSMVIFFMFNDNSIIKNLDIFALYVVAIFKMAPAFNKILYQLQDLKSSIIPAKEILSEIKSLEKTDLDFIRDDQNSVIKLDFKNKISFQNVSFSYPGLKKKVINNFNLEIKKNSITGICGPSGGGKTTLINLLLGFNIPDSGNIIVDDYDISKNIKSFQNLLGYVPQDIYLLNDTIKNNILFGLNQNKVDTDKFNQLIENCNLKELINQSEKGLDTLIGEKASKISGGQAQRICIARALMNDTNILILDEATSKLDKENEKEILDKLVKNFSNKLTIIIISHRDKMLKNFCDNIYSIDKGELKLIHSNEK